MYTLDALDHFQVTKPENTYIYDIVPTAAGLATISSDDVLRVLDIQNINEKPLKEIKNVNKDVTCLKAVDATGEAGAVVVAAAGRDGRVGMWDLRTGEKVAEVRSGMCVLPCFQR